MAIQPYLDALNLQTQTQGLAQLQELVTNHLALFSFSSLNAMQGTLLSLNLQDVLERLVIKRQGGYCFEHNKLAYYALQALGYEVTPLLARVKLNGREDNPRTHRTTLVKWANKTFLIDVGFGAQCPQAPLDVSRSSDVCVGLNTYRIVRNNDGIDIKLISPVEVNLYSVDFSFVTELDFEVGHFYSHQHPNAAFVQNLVLTRHADGYLYTLNNGLYKKTNLETRSAEEWNITLHDELTRILKQHFLVEFEPEKTHRSFDHILSYRRAQEAISSTKNETSEY